MALNTLAYAEKLQKKLDNQAVLGLTSGWMDANAGQVEYNGGNRIKMPEIETSGLKDYDRDNGYPEGSVTLQYKDYDMTMDRGASFQLDAMDVNETNFIANATIVCNVFQKEHVLPEIDAYRYSKIYKLLKEAGRNTVYTAKASDIWRMLQEDIAKVRDEIGEETPLVVTISQPVKTTLELNERFTKILNVAEFKAGVINTRVKEFNNCFLKPVPSSRMKTSYIFRDGKTEGEKEGGFAPTENAKGINWIITPQNVPIAVTKQDKMKVIDPNTYQKADAWFIGYRRYHEVWVPKGRQQKCWVNAEQETEAEAGGGDGNA